MMSEYHEDPKADRLLTPAHIADAAVIACAVILLGCAAWGVTPAELVDIVRRMFGW
jgi:hypothetical protein